MSARVAPPPRLLAVVVPVCAAGLAAVVAAAVSFAAAPQPSATLVGVVALLLVSMLAERYPVPLEGMDTGGVTLTFVFGVAAIVLFGWAAGTLIFFAAPAIMHLLEHRPPIRALYNASVFAVSAALAGGLAALVDGDNGVALVVTVTLAASTHYGVNAILVTAVVAVSAGKGFARSLRSSFRLTIVPFALMASAALMLVVLWQRSPALSAALAGPLLAIALYQRSTHREMRAMRLALTDPLTGLGNHRHFHERLQRELADAQQRGTPLTLCLIDLDDFKRVNDRYGHPAGDRLLAQVAARLRQGGEAFRLGGDEFAVLLPGLTAGDAVTAATSIVDRIASIPVDEDETATVSAGVATFPSQGVGRDELIRLADSALYWAKEHGKNRVRAYRPDVVELAELRRLAEPDRGARYCAAASLSKAVDARDPYTGGHSERVGELAARTAERLGCDPEQVEVTRLAARLHDLGKLAVPEELLRKSGPLTDGERLVLERHPQIAFGMLETLGVDPVAEAVLHHHERWDGGGYPDGLVGEAIPLPARIVHVADAYDAMTSERSYRGRLSHDDALAELERCAGTQFDPLVVAAVVEELAAPLPAAVAV